MAEQYSMHTVYASLLSSYSNYDIEWVQFVRDHYYHIKRKATIVELNPFKHNSMRYRLADFLSENNVPKEMAWIVLMINQLESEAKFCDLNIMLLPDVTDIKELREIFDNQRSHKRRIQNAE